MRNVGYRIFQVIYWVSLALTAGWGALAKFDLARLNGHADAVLPLLQLLQRFSWLSAFAAGSVALCTFAMKVIGPPWVREAVKEVLNEMHAHAFAGRSRAEFADRITLFRFQRICFRRGRSSWKPWGTHLVPIVRSGFLRQKSSVVFSVPDSASFEGVAGFAYSTNTAIPLENLPDVSASALPTNADFEEYAKKTFVKVEWLRKERSTARSLYGIPVRVDGKPWGAIVVDSQQTAMPNQAQVLKSYGLVAVVLQQLLKRS